MDIKVGLEAIAEASKKLSNWARWGADDQIGTLNFITPQDIVNATKLVRKGKAFSLGIPLDGSGPQTGLFGRRFNPIHMMLHSGVDGIALKYEGTSAASYADDVLIYVCKGRHIGIRSATYSIRIKCTMDTMLHKQTLPEFIRTEFNTPETR